MILYADEAGSTGEDVASDQQPVFVHATVAVDADRAAEAMARLRSAVRSSAPEIKAAKALKSRRPEVIRWLRDDPVWKHTTVIAHVTEKHYFVVSKFVSLVIEEHLYSQGRTPGADLERDFALLLGGALHNLCSREEEQEFLHNFTQLARCTLRNGVRPGPEGLVRLLGALYRRSEGTHFRTVAQLALDARHELVKLPHSGSDYDKYQMDPLWPALMLSLSTWCAKWPGTKITVVHDRYGMLEASQYRDMFLRAGAVAGLWHSVETAGDIASLETRDSALDPGLQLADYVATSVRVAAEGVARREIGDDLARSVGRWLHPDGGMWTPRSSLHHWWAESIHQERPF